MPGVAFDISDPANVKPMLTHIKRISAVVTYGRPRWMAWYMGDPPRKIVTRYMQRLTGRARASTTTRYYHMNVATEPQLEALHAARRPGDGALRLRTRAMPPPAPTRLDNARLPRWLLPAAWPERDGAAGARAHHAAARTRASTCCRWAARPVHADTWDLHGAPVLPGFVDAHTHLDKAFTLPRMRARAARPAGRDRRDDGRPRALDRRRRARARRRARCNGPGRPASMHVRTHVDWWEPEGAPVAWNVMRRTGAANGRAACGSSRSA